MSDYPSHKWDVLINPPTFIHPYFLKYIKGGKTLRCIGNDRARLRARCDELRSTRDRWVQSALNEICYNRNEENLTQEWKDKVKNICKEYKESEQKLLEIDKKYAERQASMEDPYYENIFV